MLHSHSILRRQSGKPTTSCYQMKKDILAVLKIWKGYGPMLKPCCSVIKLSVAAALAVCSEPVSHPGHARDGDSSFYRRALFFAAFVPIGFVPFSSARLRLHAALEQVFDSSRKLFQLTLWIGVVCDVILAAQFLTARFSEPVLFIHAPWHIVGWVDLV